MKFLIVVAAIAACAVAFPEGPSKITTLKDLFQTDASRIISGAPAKVGQLPWQVAVHFTTNQGTFFCGGALISDTWVLTAAHCVDGATSFTLRLGGITLNSQESGRVDVTTTSYIIHEGYNSRLNNDIAVIRMNNPVTLNDRIQPVKLPSRGSSVGVGQKLTVSGWGKTSDASNQVSNTLNFVELTSISNPDCAAIYGSSTIISSTICCKGNPEHSTCNGDSGGPLVSIVNGVATHVGVVSFVHINGCASGNPSGYVRTESMLDWISKNTGISV